MENAANSHDFNPIRFDLEIRIVLVEIQEMQPLDWRKGGGGREEGRKEGEEEDEWMWGEVNATDFPRFQLRRVQTLSISSNG